MSRLLRESGRSRAPLWGLGGAERDWSLKLKIEMNHQHGMTLMSIQISFIDEESACWGLGSTEYRDITGSGSNPNSRNESWKRNDGLKWPENATACEYESHRHTNLPSGARLDVWGLFSQGRWISLFTERSKKCIQHLCWFKSKQMTGVNGTSIANKTKQNMMLKSPDEDLSSRRASFLSLGETIPSQTTKQHSLVHPEGDTLRSPESSNRRPLKSRKVLIHYQIPFKPLRLGSGQSSA